MENIWKKIKYNILVPFLISISNIFYNKKKKYHSNYNNDLFFILGSGRNGSTLLALLLNRHSKIFLPPEQFVLPYSIMAWYINPFIKWQKYIKKQLNYYLYRNQNWELNSDDFNIIYKDLKNTEVKSPKHLFIKTLEYYSKKTDNNKKLYGDHSPISTVLYKYIFTEFSNAKYIFLIRHPFDVILSYSKMKNNPASNPIYAAWKWNNSIKAYDSLIKKGYNIHLLKYENLVINTDVCMKNILLFLDVEFEVLNKILTNEKLNDTLGASNYSHHKNLYKPITGQSINKWKTELDKNTIKKTMPLLIKNATRFGYDLNYN